MTTLLDKAIAKVSKLPTSKQDAIASIILDELEDDELWDKQFAGSQDKLSKLASKVRRDIACRLRQADRSNLVSGGT